MERCCSSWPCASPSAGQRVWVPFQVWTVSASVCVCVLAECAVGAGEFGDLPGLGAPADVDRLRARVDAHCADARAAPRRAENHGHLHRYLPGPSPV
eukprot:1093609-Rhodomonas_salina.2